MGVTFFMLLYYHLDTLFFHFHYLSFMLTLVSFNMLAKSSQQTTLDADFDELCKRVFSVAISVNYCSTAFYWAIVYDDEMH